GASDSMLCWEPRLSELLSFGDPNVEELVASGAQLILADGTQHMSVAEQLSSLGIPVVLYRAETAEALKEAVSLTGTILGPNAEAQADAFIADYDRIVDSIAADVADLNDADRVRVLFLGTSPTTAISGDMYQSALIESAGGRSVTQQLFGAWNEINLEQILLWNPDVIIIPPYGPVLPVDLLADPDWQALEAVQSGRVHRIPRLIAPMDTPVPESLLCIAWLAKTFYPDLVTVDLHAEIEDFYRAYYQLALTAEEIDWLASP
ncbi:ABC transporter substrate-binding protein, partial [Candidatus Bipolaricaulota bacterium]|nr:ABC transporter substrate-binding protein [Candidatus Bipolaricaulota bacterium]